MVGLGVAAVTSLAGLALCWTAVRSRAHRRAPGSTPYALLTGALGITALLHVPFEVVPVAAFVAGAVLWFVVPIVWALFAFEFTGRYDVRSTDRRLLLLGAGVLLGAVHLTTIATATSVLGISLWEFEFTTYFELAAALEGLPGTAISVLTMTQFMGNIAIWGIMAVATIVVVGQATGHESLDVRMGVALPVAALGPWVTNFVGLSVVGMNDMAYDAYMPALALSFLVSATVFVGSVERYDLFGATPVAATVGPERVLEDISEPVVVVDHDERVIRANPAARDAFGVADGFVGAGLSTLVDHELAALQTETSVTISGPSGKRHYEPSVSPMRDRSGGLLGYTVVLRDVTGREVRQQRLQVLNRVLRHNLRNDVTTIRGRAELLADGEGDASEIGDAITDSAEDLVGLGDRAREIEQMLSVPRTDDQRTELAPIVEEVAEDLRRAESAEVEVAVPADLVVDVDERVIRVVVRNLVENAVAHNDSEAPWVRISASREGGALPVSLRVADDGPGIPENERVAVESGEEEPLEHGSGLGLWAVKWGVTRMGGTLSFADKEPRGTVVELGLPGESAAARGRDGGAAEDVAESG